MTLESSCAAKSPSEWEVEQRVLKQADRQCRPKSAKILHDYRATNQDKNTLNDIIQQSRNDREDQNASISFVEEQKIDDPRDTPVGFPSQFLYSIPDRLAALTRPRIPPKINGSVKFEQLRTVLYAGPKGNGAKETKALRVNQSETDDRMCNPASALGEVSTNNLKFSEGRRNFDGKEDKEEPSSTTDPTRPLQKGLLTMISNPPEMTYTTRTHAGSTFLLEALDNEYGFFGEELLHPIPFYWTGAPISSSPRRVIIMFTDSYGMESGNHKLVADSIAELLNNKTTAVMIPDLFRRNPLVKPRSSTPEKIGAALDVGAMLFRLKFKNRPERIERDLKEMLFPWLHSQFDDIDKVSFSCIGFCYGAWIMARALALKNSFFDCGVGIHPSFTPEEVHGGSSEHLAHKIGTLPCLLLSASNDHDLKPSSKPVQILAQARRLQADQVSREFGTMIHGWVTRGDSTDANVSTQQEIALKMATDFISQYSR